MTVVAGGLIGRERECAQLDDAVVPGALVTLTGPGGVGKTRLVTEFVARLEERVERPVRLALLDELAAGADASAVVDAFGFESLDGAAVMLAERPGTLVLDNCEHVLDGARQVATALRASVPELSIVATSRQPLGLDDEVVIVIGPLAVPPPGGIDALASPAVQLFLERAGSAGARLDPDARLLADVAELCRRLDGLPLAIELAAVRTRAIAPADLLEVVGKRLDVLRRSRSGTDVETMQAAIDVSVAQLAPAERTFFRRLGAFTGPFDLALAHAVAGEPGSDRTTSIDLLAGLVDRSLVTAEAIGPITRYRLLELLHEHAGAELREQGELAAIEERFVQAMLAVADGIVVDALSRWDARLLAVASGQFANLVRACELCLDRDAGPHRAYRLLLPMYAALHEGRPDDVWALGARVMARWGEQPAPWRAEALAVLASAAAIAGRADEVGPLAASIVDDPDASAIAAALADRAWGLAVRPRDASSAARHFALARRAAATLGASSLAGELQVFEAGELDLAGDHDGAMALLDDVLARAADADDRFITVLTRVVRARVLARAGGVTAAEDELAAAESTSASVEQAWWRAAILRTKAAVASLGPGGWNGATGHWRHAIDDAAGNGAVGEIALSLRAAATAAWHLGQREVAATLWRVAPRSTAITVVSEMFPEARRELAESVPAAPAGHDLVGALALARSMLSPTGAETAAGDEAASAPPAVRTGQLTKEGDGWQVRFAGRVTRVRDMKGIADLAVLVTRPGREIHALELMGAQDVGGAAGPAIDDRARRTYQTRIVELQRDIDEARADHDVRRAERAELELDALVEQLSEAFGLGGRARRTGSSAERARTAVTYRIRSAIRKLAEVHPELGRHFGHAVRTGTWCSYQPETDVSWKVELLS